MMKTNPSQEKCFAGPRPTGQPKDSASSPPTPLSLCAGVSTVVVNGTELDLVGCSWQIESTPDGELVIRELTPQTQSSNSSAAGIDSRQGSDR
jgi:hypothetical protein